MRKMTCQEFCQLDFKHHTTLVRNADIRGGKYQTELRAAGWTDYPDGAHGQRSDLDGISKYTSLCGIVLSVLWRAEGDTSGTYCDLFNFSNPVLRYEGYPISESSWDADNVDLSEDSDCEEWDLIDDFIQTLDWREHAKNAYPPVPGPKDYDYVGVDEDIDESFKHILVRHGGPPVRLSGVLVWAHSDWEPFRNLSNLGNANKPSFLKSKWWNEFRLYRTFFDRFALHHRIRESHSTNEFYTVKTYDCIEDLMEYGDKELFATGFPETEKTGQSGHL